MPKEYLNLSRTNVVGALAFTVGFIVAAAHLPAYLSGTISPLLMLIPVILCVGGGVLFVLTKSEVDAFRHRRDAT